MSRGTGRTTLLQAAALCGLLLPGAPVLLHAQQSRNCFVDIDSAGRAYQQVAGGAQLWFAGGWFAAHCRDQPVTMRSDSVEWYSDRGELRLLGRVHFQDSVAILDADRVVYWTRQERLVATGNVYTRNLRSGSDLRGPSLEYLRAVPPLRDTLELYAPGRPTIQFFPAQDTARADSTSEPFVIVADRTWMRGQEVMWGSGHVTIDRSDLAARADSAFIDLRDSVGLLIGAPVVTAKDTVPDRDSVSYRLTGRRIRFEMTGGDRIRRVLSLGDADALGPDWRLTADTLDLALDSSRIQRAQAWGREARPVAHSDLSTIVADSLDIRMPGQVMDEVLAYGAARATSRPDSIQPEDDWLAGDSLRAAFVARTDSAGTRRSEISRVVAFGNASLPARAYYHVQNDRDPDGPRGINYSRGQRIRIAMRERRVRTVDVVGEVDGVYLEPLPPAADTAATDTSAADTTGTGGGPQLPGGGRDLPPTRGSGPGAPPSDRSPLAPAAARAPRSPETVPRRARA